MAVRAAPCRDDAEIDAMMTGLAREERGGVLVMLEMSAAVHRDVIVAAAARHRLPAVDPNREIRRKRRTDVLRDRSSRPVPPHGCLCRSHPEGREPGRFAGAKPKQVRVDDESQDCEITRHRIAPTLLATADEVID